MSQYTVLKNLSTMTIVEDVGQNEFLMLVNSIAHEPMEIQEPEYEPRNSVGNTRYDAEHPTRLAADGRTLSLQSQCVFEIKYGKRRMEKFLNCD